MSLSTRIDLNIKGTLSEVKDLGTKEFPSEHDALYTWASGTGANQADRLFSDERQLNASASENLDVSGGLTDEWGALISLARVKAFIITADSGNTNNVNVTMGTTNGVPGIFTGASEGVIVRPGGAFVWVAPAATGAEVTDSTGDILTVTNSAGGTPVTYKVTIIGVGA